MRVRDLMRRTPVTVAADATVTEAARLMDEAAVGALVVVDEASAPLGVVTDRDLTVRVLARRLPSDARVDSVMSTDVVSVEAGAEDRELLDVISGRPVRRVLVLEDGVVVGLVGVDDLIVNIATDLGRLVRPVAGQVLFGHPEAQPPAVLR